MLATEVQCPFCDHWADDMIRLAPHVHCAHETQFSVKQRLDALKNVHPVPKKPVDPWPGELDLSNLPVPTAPVRDEQREELHCLIAANSLRLERVRDEMEGLKSELAGLNIRAARISTDLDRPDYVKRAEQNRILDALIDAKLHEAATLVMKMIREG